MSLLEHPDAQVHLAEAVVTPDEVRGCQDRITTFLSRMSFGVYLIHPLLIRALMGISGDAERLAIRTVVVAALSVAITWLLWISPLQILVRNGKAKRARAERAQFTTARTPAPAPRA